MIFVYYITDKGLAFIQKIYRIPTNNKEKGRQDNSRKLGKRLVAKALATSDRF